MWKVYGYMEGHDGNERFPSRCPTIYGPLPRKRWIPVAGERYRVKRPKISNPKDGASVKEYTASRAALYAEWLAKRDGLTVPNDCKVGLCWSEVTVPHKAKPEPRVYAVVWDRHEWSQSERVTTVTRVLTVSIPNWDWVPQMTEEHDPEIDSQLPLAA